MSRSYPKVAIIILHFDNRQNLIECLSSIQQISYSNYNTIVVQNGNRSLIDSASIQSNSPSSLEFIRVPQNVGYACGNNLGIRKALENGADYLLLLNDDTMVAPNFLDILVEEGEKSPNTRILGPKIYYANEPKKIWFAGAKFDSRTCRLLNTSADEVDPSIDEEPFDSDYITGCALMIKRDLIEKIGLLDERFFLYWEDVDWCIRAKTAGFRNILVPHSHIWHKVSVSMGGTESPLKAYHKTRSHLLFAKLHALWAIKKLHERFFRDVAWLLFKSTDRIRFRKAQAFMAGIRDYHLGKTDEGPDWLWSE